MVLGDRIAGGDALPGSAVEIAVPAEHSVLSVAVDERVPPLEPGDVIDLYLRMAGFAGAEGEITKPTEPSLVIATSPAALTVAVPDAEVPDVAAALSVGSVLVVRR